MVSPQILAHHGYAEFVHVERDSQAFRWAHWSHDSISLRRVQTDGHVNVSQ
jgi:hypothetical protein